MAKQYSEVFFDSLETLYSSNQFPLQTLSNTALRSGRVRLGNFAIQGSDTDNTGNQIIIQRLKRPKASNSAQDITKGGADNFIARVNAAKRLEWDTVATSATIKRDLLIEIPLNAKFDVIEDGSSEARQIASTSMNKMYEDEETYTKDLFSTVTPTQLDVDGSTDKDLIAMQLIKDAALRIKLFVDDFKAYSKNPVALIHPELAGSFAQTHGLTYYSAPDTTFTDTPTQMFQYGGITFIVSDIINTISDSSTATTRAGVILLDAEAFITADSSFGFVPVDFTLIDTRYVGHTYGSWSKAIDIARVATFTFTSKIAESFSSTNTCQ